VFVKTGISNKLRNQLISCIELLDKEFTSLDFSIIVYETRESLERERHKKPSLPDDFYHQILNGVKKPVGLTIADQNLIHLYKFNNTYQNKNHEKLELVANLFHEIRHAWQHVNGKFKDEEEIRDIDNNKKKYFQLPSEQDAYQFQADMVNTHRDSIIRIMEMNQGFGIYSIKKEI
jgi:hypothetical protein